MTQSANELSIFDQQVLRLEAQVNKLQASLTHWQQWYFDYSALKEEVDILPKDEHQRKELARIRRDFESDLLTKKEINELFGKNDLKEAHVISNLLARRIEYVEQNLESLKKLIEKEENKLLQAEIVAHPDGGVDDETGLPITDIVEQLDDDDNVLQYQLRSGADAAPHVVDALKKLGINEIPETEADLPKDEVEPEEEPVQIDAETSPPPAKSVESAEKPAALKKGVSFADDTKPGHLEAEPPKSRAAQQLEEIMKKAKEQEAMDMSKAVIPENESPEDAKLRREMLEYGMSEIGPVVAELQLDEDSAEDDEDWDDDYEASEFDEDEDDLGRSQHTVITDDYIKRMQELEKRLGFQSHFTVTKPEPKSEIPEGKVGRIAVFPEVSPAETVEPSTAAPAPKVKKGVRFAPELDVAGEKKPKHSKKQVDPVGDIVEKVDALSVSDEEDQEEEDPPKRVSRFKKERKAVAPPSKSPVASLPQGPHQVPASFLNQVAEAEPQPLSLAPEGQTLSDVVIERNVTAAPKQPSDVDDELLYQAAAVEYNRLRNKMIQKEGGFMKQPEQEIVPLDEEEGGPPRMSRFKAARLARS